MTVKQFSVDNIAILLNVDYRVTGLASNSFVTITEGTPRFKVYTDIDGKNTFTQSLNKTAEIKLTLKANSDTIDYITEYLAAIEGNIVSGLSILIIDKNAKKNTKSAYGFNCKINIQDIEKDVKLPNQTFVFIPEKYYNETDLAQATSDDSNFAVDSILNDALKVKGA